MFRVKNLSLGRVQIRARGRATNGGETEVVQVIDPRLIRLRDAGLISWEGLDENFNPRPADAPPTVPAPLPVKTPEPVVKSEILAIAGEGIKEVLPVTEVVEESPVAAAIKQENELAELLDKVEYLADDSPATAPEVLPEPEPEPDDTDADEPAPVEEVEPEDQRITFERERLSAGDWKDIKAEAKDKGIKGRSRDTIEQRLLELFASTLS